MKRASRAAAFAATISTLHDERAIDFCRADDVMVSAPRGFVARGSARSVHLFTNDLSRLGLIGCIFLCLCC